MVKDTIDLDPKYIFQFLNVQSNLLWLFQSQDVPKIKKCAKIHKMCQNIEVRVSRGKLGDYFNETFTQ